MNENAPKFLTVAEVAELLRKSPKRVREYIRQQRIVATKPDGFNNWLIPEAELKRYVNGGVNG